MNLQSQHRSPLISLYESKHNEKDVVQPHHHQNHQILYILDGEGICMLNGVQQALKKDCFMIIPPGVEHSIHSHSKTSVLVLEFDAGSLGEDIQQEVIPYVFQKACVLQLNTFDSSDVRQLLRKKLYEQSHRDLFWQMTLKNSLSEMLIIISRSYTQEAADLNSLRVEQLKRYIETRYFDIRSAEDLANRLGISKRYLQQIFKEYYNMTPLHYLTEVRIGRVKKELLETEKDIVSICFEMGFESLSTFYRLFKKMVGVSPNVYRTTYKSK
ncbi:transcriptional regulator, AraC family [Fictibacillus solisalsi]|uniref:Transcriptional regulator, AraC family n=1 Tax=Fictibacillus solisalsi TaxID=459525 RepID=A0A1G9YEK7_9BACL|nr:helix-turn-helix domain-containing protein [Fictibacillus solisalsi]SDN07502.1 transcriptional regulator, AraC family [Fictibacillus solisalsi]